MWVRADERASNAVERLAALYESVEAGAFWAAVVFPVCYLPFLVVGVGTAERALAFGGLVTVHVLLLTLGHAHGR